jgi:tRNA(fMet)-specific endonuclease VapC
VRLRHLLDTDTLSDLVVRPQGKVAGAIVERGEASVCTSVVVASELRYGAVKRGSARLTRQVEIILSAVRILPFEEPADRRYAELRAHLESAGTPIGPNDMLIAAHALALGLIVVSGNDREFTRVPGLAVENWLA